MQMHPDLLIKKKSVLSRQVFVADKAQIYPNFLHLRRGVRISDRQGCSNSNCDPKFEH